jgi:hypothetical protein
MRALVELTPAERKMMQTLTQEEREAVIEQLLEKVREELEWVVVVDRARSQPPPPPPTVPGRHQWAATRSRAR